MSDRRLRSLLVAMWGAPVALAAARADSGDAGGTAAPPPSAPTDVFMSILPYAAVIIVVTIVGGVIMMISRRKIDSASAAGPVGFNLSDLKELRDRGELSEAEYERARQEVIARARKAFRVGGDGPPVR